MTLIEVSPLAVVVSIVITFIVTTVAIVVLIRYREEGIKRSLANKNQIDKLTSEMALMQKQFSPFWTMVQDRIAHDLTHPSPQFEEMDNLLRKLGDLTLTLAERSRLKVLLEMRRVTDDPEVNTAEKLSAELMLGVMHKALEESDQIEAKQAKADVLANHPEVDGAK